MISMAVLDCIIMPPLPRPHLMPWSHLCVKPPRIHEPRMAILGIWGDTWLTRGKYGIYVAVRGSYGTLTGSTRRLLPRKISPISLLLCLLRGGNEDSTLVSAA